MNGNAYYVTSSNGAGQLRSERHYPASESGNIRRRYVVDARLPPNIPQPRKNIVESDEEIRYSSYLGALVERLLILKFVSDTEDNPGQYKKGLQLLLSRNSIT